MPSKSEAKRCPLCRKPSTRDHAPFCSPGCRNRDLLKWLGEGYRIPGHPADPQQMGGLDSETGEG